MLRAIWSLAETGSVVCLSCCCSGRNDLALFSFQGRVFHAPFTVMARGVVLAAQALPRHRVAVIRVAIALTGLAARKAPVPGQAAVTLPRVHPLETVALAGDGIAESIDRSLQVALAG